MPVSIDFHAPDLDIKRAVEEAFKGRFEDWYVSVLASANNDKIRIKIELRSAGFRRSSLSDVTPDFIPRLVSNWLREFDICEKLGQAVAYLTETKDTPQEKLFFAYRNFLLGLNVHLPAPLEREFREIEIGLRSQPEVDSEGTLRPTISRMNEREVQHWVGKITSLYQRFCQMDY